MAYDRQWLRDQVASYLHDAATSPLLDTWIDIGAKRVSSVLRCWEMESELSVGLAVVTELGVADGGSASGGGTIIDGGDAFAGQVQQDSFITLPAGVQDILGVQWQNNSGEWINLTALSKHEAGPYKRAGTPSHYLIENRRIYPYPIADGNYKAQSVSEVVIPAGGRRCSSRACELSICISKCGIDRGV